jgi:hypothetical protein
VYNLGGGGSGPSEQRAILSRFGIPKKPSVVLWGFLEGNDLEDGVTWENAERESTKLETHNKFILAVLKRIDGILVLDFPFAILRRVQYTRDTQPKETEGYLKFNSAKGQEIVPFNYYEKSAAELTVYRGFEIFKKEFLAARDEVSHNGGQMCLIYFPNKGHAYSEHISENDHPDLNRYLLNIEAKRNLITDFCRKENIPMIDLTDEFKKEANPWDFYFLHDGHMNARGNERVANAIAAYLERKRKS